ncbi:hypothetical protein KCP69_01295 [Salmonella enterica subsp. enterica]|nr:hypothetical protein KCP69_01295 [Salmonella enterica subsp. enterica]
MRAGMGPTGDNRATGVSQHAYRGSDRKRPCFHQRSHVITADFKRGALDSEPVIARRRPLSSWGVNRFLQHTFSLRTMMSAQPNPPNRFRTVVTRG